MKIFSNPCKKRDRKATEEAILMAASKLFAEKGYEGTRTLEIAKEAGANEALIGRYFGGKEGLLIALMKNQTIVKTDEHAKLDEFPTADQVKDLRHGILTFFKNGAKSLEMKQEFARIGCARAMVDPEMAEVIRSHIIDLHLPEVVKSLRTYFDDKKVKKKELESAAFLIMSVNFNMNFMGRKVYNMDDESVDSVMELLAASLQAYFTP